MHYLKQCNKRILANNGCISPLLTHETTVKYGLLNKFIQDKTELNRGERNA